MESASWWRLQFAIFIVVLDNFGIRGNDRVDSLARIFVMTGLGVKDGNDGIRRRGWRCGRRDSERSFTISAYQCSSWFDLQRRKI